MKHRKVWAAVAVLIMVMVAGLYVASNYMLSYALKPAGNKGRDYAAQWSAMREGYPWMAAWMDSLRQTAALRDTFVTAPDGDRHHALLLHATPHTSRTAVLVHGYTDCAIDMLHIGYIYNHLLGMNLVLPDLHASGKSDGKAIQMGWPDRLDVLHWTHIADSLFADSTGQSHIVVHGISMGAATTMALSGEPLPASVRCLVEDCGYTSVWDEFAGELQEQFGLPEFPLLYTASALCRVRYGWSFGQSSPLRQVAKCRKPMLFIHGGDDTYVPTRMVYQLYAAKPAPKRLVVFPKSHHARSYHDYPDRYAQVVKEFVKPFL